MNVSDSERLASGLKSLGLEKSNNEYELGHLVLDDAAQGAKRFASGLGRGGSFDSFKSNGGGGKL